MSKNGFFINFEDFDKKFRHFIEEAGPKIAGEGLFTGANALLRDSDDEEPQTPYKTGDLRASRKVERPVIKGSDIEVIAGYNKIYAARLHEGEPTWKFTRTKVTKPGPKFLESKMAKNARKYMQICADYIKTKLEGGRA